MTGSSFKEFDLVTMGLKFAVLKQSGAWVMWGEEKYNGNKEIRRALKNDKKLFDKLYAIVGAKAYEDKFLSEADSVIDEAQIKAIKEKKVKKVKDDADVDEVETDEEEE